MSLFKWKRKSTVITPENKLGGKLEELADENLPIIASGKTGLASEDEAIVMRVPADYSQKTVRDCINYVLEQPAKDADLSIMSGLKKVMNAKGRVVMVNGRNADLDADVIIYLVKADHELEGGAKKVYRKFEFEVSSVQEGGYRN